MALDYARRVQYWRWRIGRDRGEGLSQAQFAEIIGRTPGAVSCWESGLYRPSPESIARIEEEAEVPEGRFYGPLPAEWREAAG